MKEKKIKKPDQDKKLEQLDLQRMKVKDKVLTTDQGVPIPHTDDSLKAGAPGPTLIEDFHLREKLTRFDHERIPERVVHARGAGAHGHFQVYKTMTEYTKAKFLQDPNVKTPVFVRFSTVLGSRGSADTARDVRGFAVKFYTEDGNYDLVGNNIPIFFIQDGIKFSDLIHAGKPEPHHEIPQAATAHDTFWDFMSLVPETTHMAMWILSDRALPRSFAMMQGFGVHTWRFVNTEGKSRFVKFHWKPLLGVHSLVWDEAQKISGKDPDFHRRDLWESIESGRFPEYELGVQIVEEEDIEKFEFSLFDATKIIPEEVVPVQPIGKLVLNRNPDNYFAETEQVAFCTANLVPGIDVTDDPLLQARHFSYLDTQLKRLGGPNFAQISINRPITPVNNNQQDGHMQQAIPVTRANYFPNSIEGGCPFLASMKEGFSNYEEKIPATTKTRSRNEKFKDHFSQATLFWNSMSEIEKTHIIQAASFELGMVERKSVRERMLGNLAQVDEELAAKVSQNIGVPVPKVQPVFRTNPGVSNSPSLSQIEMAKRVSKSIRGRKVAILATDGFRSTDVKLLLTELEKQGAVGEFVSSKLGEMTSDTGERFEVKKSLLTTHSVLFDAVFIAGGKVSFENLQTHPEFEDFINDAYKHCKTVGATWEATELLSKFKSTQGIVISKNQNDDKNLVERFILSLAEHRHWSRGFPLSQVSAPSAA